VPSLNPVTHLVLQIMLWEDLNFWRKWTILDLVFRSLGMPVDHKYRDKRLKIAPQGEFNMENPFLKSKALQIVRQKSYTEI
jgi:hypothetical protein